jgi:preprotein translocase subunit SecD
MRKWWDRLSVLLIIAVAAGAAYAVWPDEPDRYMPDWLADRLPSGRGIPSTILGVDLPCKADETNDNPSADCRGMTLGLDLRGGSRTVLEADVAGLDVTEEQICEGLDAAKDIVESRVNPFGVSEASVQKSGCNRLIIELPGVSQEKAEDITRPAVLMFCEPLQEGGQGAGTGAPIGFVATGQVIYRPGTCDPDVADDGTVAVLGFDGSLSRAAPTFVDATSFYSSGGSADQIVWTPAQGELDGQLVTMTGQYLDNDASILFDTIGRPILEFSVNDTGREVFGTLTQRITGLPMATFLDGEPIRGAEGRVIAPIVRGRIDETGFTEGLTLADARRLRTFLNNGAFPIPLRVVQQQDVDATLGDEAVLHSVEAGIVAMLLIMGYMILYYRLPGLLASTALVVYAAVALAVFKIGIPGSGPVTLTLAGIAAFVLSVGMAVDANILIFERMREELRYGRSLVPAVEAGFDRAWSSIRDSNVATLITCGILYWMGNEFGSSLIKGFSLTLAIGVMISMFSAITMTRTLLRLATATPLVRRLWLWTDDHPDTGTPTTRAATMEAAEHA